MGSYLGNSKRIDILCHEDFKILVNIEVSFLTTWQHLVFWNNKRIISQPISWPSNSTKYLYLGNLHGVYNSRQKHVEVATVRVWKAFFWCVTSKVQLMWTEKGWGVSHDNRNIFLKWKRRMYLCLCFGQYTKLIREFVSGFYYTRVCIAVTEKDHLRKIYTCVSLVT